MPISSPVARRLGSVVVLTSLAALALGLAGCPNNDQAPPGTSTSSGGATPDKSAPLASASASNSDVVPLLPSASAASSAVSAAPSAATKPIADAGAPADAGVKVTKDAGPPADAGPTTATDAGVVALSPAAALAKQIDAIYADKKTFSAKFKQEYVLKVVNQTKTSSGVVFIERPNKISFRYDAPNKNRIVSDGKTLKVYIAEDNQMIEKPVENSQYPGAFGFLMGNGISSSFTFTINDKVAWKDGPVLQGKPTSPTPDYEAATFFLNKVLLDKSDPGAIARVSLTDAQGNKNRFDLGEATRPATIDPGEFLFTAPAGTNIIR